MDDKELKQCSDDLYKIKVKMEGLIHLLHYWQHKLIEKIDKRLEENEKIMIKNDNNIMKRINEFAADYNRRVINK